MSFISRMMMLILVMVCCFSIKVEASHDITSVSGLGPDELEYIVSGSGLSGLGQTFYEMENTYGVNAVFAISVAQLESGNGESVMARYDNNLFGLMGMSFSSREKCIVYFGDLIRNYYFDNGMTTTYSINPVYCPDNYEWASYIESLMSHNYYKVGK